MTLAETQADRLEALEKLAQRLDLGWVGQIVDAVHAELALFFQRFGGGDVGSDHELFDQLVAVKALASLDPGNAPLAVEDDAALRQVEIEGAALGARLGERRVGAVERRHDGLDEWLRCRIGRTVTRRLKLLVGQPGRRAHQPAHEAMTRFLGSGK